MLLSILIRHVRGSWCHCRSGSTGSSTSLPSTYWHLLAPTCTCLHYHVKHVHLVSDCTFQSHLALTPYDLDTMQNSPFIPVWYNFPTGYSADEKHELLILLRPLDSYPVCSVRVSRTFLYQQGSFLQLSHSPCEPQQTLMSLGCCWCPSKG